jgi:hypothetical protein
MPRTSERARMLQRLHALQSRTEQRHKRLKMNARRHQVAATNNDEDDEDIENDSEPESKEPDPPRPPINYHTALLDRLIRLRYWKPRGGEYHLDKALSVQSWFHQTWLSGGARGLIAAAVVAAEVVAVTNEAEFLLRCLSINFFL